MKNIVIACLLIPLIISATFNFFLYRGLVINVDKSITTHSESFSTAMSGSMVVMGSQYTGNKLERRREFFNTEEEANLFINKLPEFSYLWHKQIYCEELNKYVVKYPYFFEEMKKSK